MNWVVCRVPTGKEYEIRKKLKQLDDKAEIWIPRRYFIEFKNKKPVDRSERILPGYILVGSESDINPIIFKNFLKYIGPINEEEALHLISLEGDKKETLEIGAKVLVIEGPFQGCKGNILKELGEGVFECRIVFQGMSLTVKMQEGYINVIS